jgi:hypothetical protein
MVTEMESQRHQRGNRTNTQRGGGADTQRGGAMMSEEEMVQQYDTDGDGVLSETERQAAMTTMRSKRSGGRNTGNQNTGANRGSNGSGSGSGMMTREQMMAKYDVDGDGTLSETEKATMLAELRAQRNQSATTTPAE